MFVITNQIGRLLVLVSAFALIGMTSVASAQDAPRSDREQLETVALEACSAAFEARSQYEVGGAIYELDGVVYFTTPRDSGGQFRLSMQLELPANSIPLGIYHTHPVTNFMDEWFSEADIRNAQALNLPSFLCVQKKKLVRVYQPGYFTEQVRLGTGVFRKVAKGKVVGVMRKGNLVRVAKH